MVPGGGVEPPRPCDRRILSPLRLPVPPSRLWGGDPSKVSHRVWSRRYWDHRSSPGAAGFACEKSSFRFAWADRARGWCASSFPAIQIRTGFPPGIFAHFPGSRGRNGPVPAQASCENRDNRDEPRLFCSCSFTGCGYTAVARRAQHYGGRVRPHSGSPWPRPFAH